MGKFSNCTRLPRSEASVRLYGPAGQFLGIAQRDKQGRLAPRRLIASQRDAIAADSF